MLDLRAVVRRALDHVVRPEVSAVGVLAPVAEGGEGRVPVVLIERGELCGVLLPELARLGLVPERCHATGPSRQPCDATRTG